MWTGLSYFTSGVKTVLITQSDSAHPSPTEEHAHDSSNNLAAATSEVMEVTPLSAPPTKSPEQIQKSAKPKDKSKGKTSPRSMVNIKTIRAELEKTRASPIGITIQHDAR